jgi:hypothetical protein
MLDEQVVEQARANAARAGQCVSLGSVTAGKQEQDQRNLSALEALRFKRAWLRFHGFRTGFPREVFHCLIDYRWVVGFEFDSDEFLS